MANTDKIDSICYSDFIEVELSPSTEETRQSNTTTKTKHAQQNIKKYPNAKDVRSRSMPITLDDSDSISREIENERLEELISEGFTLPRKPNYWSSLKERLGGQDIFDARIDLAMITFDWFVDIAVGIFHIMNNNWVAGILTFAIVFGAGIVVTLGCSPFSNAEIKKEVWKMNKFFGILMYIPSFFPICTGKLRLHFTHKLQNAQEHKEKKLLRCQLKRFKERNLWDICAESTFEGVPQAVLQSYLILTRPDYDTPLAFFPILSITLALGGITTAPLTVLKSWFPHISFNFCQTITAYASKALRVLCSAIFIVYFLNTFTSVNEGTLGRSTEDILFQILWTFISALLIIIFFEIPYIINYELESCGSSWAKLNHFLIDSILFVTTTTVLILWVDFTPKFTDRPLHIVTISVYVVLMILTYFGLFYYRKKLTLYQTVAANIVIHVYISIKSCVVSLCTCKMPGKEKEQECPLE